MAYDSVTAKLDFKAGFHRESTRYAEEGSWYDGNRDLLHCLSLYSLWL